MKRSLLLALTIFVIASCTKQVDEVSNQSILPTSPVFTCSFESSETKVSVDDQNRLYWNENDYVSIFTRGLNEQYRFTGKDGDIGGTFEMISDPTLGTGSPMPAYYSVYPYNKNTQVDYEGNISVEIPAIQQYRPDSFGPGTNLMVAVTKDANDYFLPFKNTCGYLAIKLFGHNVCVKTITFKGNDNEPLTGMANIIASHSNMPELTISADGGKEIVLDCGSGVSIGKNKNDAVTFWMVVPPMTFTKGFTISIEDVNGEVFEKVSNKEQIISRNICKVMSPVNINSNYNATNVTDVTLDQSVIYFKEAGETIKLNATVYPENATNKNLFWTSFDESVAIVDKDGNVTSVGEGEVTIEVKTEDGEITAEATAKIDWSVPALESYTMTTPSSTTDIDVTDEPQTIVFRAHLTDASGVRNARIDVFNTDSNGELGERRFEVELALVEGTETDGIYEATLTLDDQTRAGSYQCDLKVWDILGNTPFLSNVAGRHHFNVINEGTDYDAPALESFTMTTPSSTSNVYITDEPQTIVFRAHLTDASGVRNARIDVFNTDSNGEVGEREFELELVLIEGTETDGIYEAILSLDNQTRSGSYQCDLKVWDIWGNTPFLSNVAGRQHFNVVNHGIDFDAPAMESFTMTTPSSTTDIDVTDEPQTIVFRAHLTDASGVRNARIDVFNTDSNGEVGEREFELELALIEGTETDGIYEATLTLDNQTRPGSYQCDLKVWDIWGNTPFLSNVAGRQHFNVINNK